MKKTQWREFLQRIRRSKVSFIAIFVFIAFGVALYTGIKWSEPAFYRSMETEYDALKLRDLEITFVAGLSEEGLAELRDLPEVSEIEGIYTTYQYFQHKGERFQAKVSSITTEMDLLRVNEGRLPETENEVAVESCWAAEHGISVGGTIVLEHDSDGNPHLLRNLMDGKMPDAAFHDDDGMQYLQSDSFLITALVDTPAGLTTLTPMFEGSPTSPAPVSLFLFVSPLAFDAEAFPGYTGVLVRSEALRGMCTTGEAYKTAAYDFADTLRPVAERLCEEQAQRMGNAMEGLKASPLGALYADVKMPSSTVSLSVRENMGCVSMSSTIGEIMRKLCINYGSVFIIIGIFVCYTTLSRLVYQEAVLSGTKKALGFFDREVMRSFLLYAIVVTVLGVAAGTLLSVLMVQPLLLGVLSETYLFREAAIIFRWKEVAVIFLLEAAAMLLSAWLACHKTLRQGPLSLLAGEEPNSGNFRFLERSRLYQKLPLLSKCIVQNFLNDRRRVIGTLIGIIGCTALTVSSITFELAVAKSMDRQFGELQRFDTIVCFDPENRDGAAQIESALSDLDVRYTRALKQSGVLMSPNGKRMITMLLVDDAAFDGMLSPASLDGTPLSIENGILLSCAFAEQYGIEPGDSVRFLATDGTEYTLPVGGIMEHYINLPRVVMTAEEYRAIFGEYPPENVFLVEKGTQSVQQIAERLSGIEGYISATDHYADEMAIHSIINMVISAIMILYLVLSVLIALFVILDILLLFVAEKKRELITLNINGYPMKYVRKYIRADTVFLSVPGILGGLMLGILLGIWDVNTMESDACYFLHGVRPFACFAGVVFSAFLVAVMLKIALRQIDRFQLSDINEV